MALGPNERMAALLNGMSDDPNLAAKVKKPKTRPTKKVVVTPELKDHLEKVGSKTRLNYSPDSTIPRCKKCRRISVRGLDVCYFHGGARIAEKRKLEKGIIRDRDAKARSNIRKILSTDGALPPGLLMTPVFKAVLLEERTLNRSKPYTSDIVTRLATLRMILYKLTFGWTRMEQDPNNRDEWTTAVKLASDHGLDF